MKADQHDNRRPARVAPLIERLDRAILGDDPAAIAGRVKSVLHELAPNAVASLPELYRRPGNECYARRLVHRADDDRYTVVVMAWGPGQGTRLHDHAGMWCVECVAQGELDVTQYELIERDGERFRFRPHEPVRASLGDAGCLIPPYEYHVLANARPDLTSITMHVYGGEMDTCNLYEPGDGGWWTRQARSLHYD